MSDFAMRSLTTDTLATRMRKREIERARALRDAQREAEAAPAKRPQKPGKPAASAAKPSPRTQVVRSRTTKPLPEHKADV